MSELYEPPEVYAPQTTEQAIEQLRNFSFRLPAPMHRKMKACLDVIEQERKETQLLEHQ